MLWVLHGISPNNKSVEKSLSMRMSLEFLLNDVGVGEGVEDLQPFDAESFVNAIFI